MFTGAVSPDLERKDYQVLPDLFPDSTDYEIIIKNEEEEEQFIDEVSLWVVHHEKNALAATDQKGNLYTITDPISPISSFASDGTDIAEFTNYDDELPYDFMISPNKMSETFFTFPAGKENGTLILKLKNTRWGGYVFSEFKQLFGKRYLQWAEKNRTKSRDELIEWQKEQGILLAVEIKKNNEWELLEYIDLIGETGFNTLVIPFSGETADPTVEIRIKSGFKLWELDYIAVDYSQDNIVQARKLEPVEALDQNGRDFTLELSQSDNIYREQLLNGEHTRVRFDGIENIKGKSRTLLLQSEGFYIFTEPEEGKTHYLSLLRLKNKGEFSVFSKELYENLSKSVISIN
jgi:hypothetical protein